MLIKQLSIFVENKFGRLAEVTKILGDAKIDIRALVVSDTTDFGILRMIVNDTERARGILKENGFTVSCTDVVVVDIPDEPGSLSKVLGILSDAAIEIEYMYAFLGRENGKAPAILRVEDVNKAVDLLQKNNINILTEEGLR